MQASVAKIEASVEDVRTELRAIDVRLTKIETRLEATATKADVQDTANATIKWMIGTGAVMFSMAIVIITFVLNNAVPKQGEVEQLAQRVGMCRPAAAALTVRSTACERACAGLWPTLRRCPARASRSPG